MSLDLSKLVNLRRNGSGWTAQCPVCAAAGRDGTNKNHLSILSDGRYNCVVDASHRSGIHALVGIGGTGGTGEYSSPPQEQVTVDRTWPASVLDRLVKEHSYWVKRGVKEEILGPLRGGVAVDGQLKGRYVFPIFGDRDEIIGFTGRSLGNIQPRWKHVSKVSRWIWGGLDEIHETGQAVLVEGAGCRLALASHDVPQSLVLWGVNMSEAVLGALIAANPHDIIIATNNEASGIGQSAAVKIRSTLNRFFDEGVVRIGLPLKKDFLEMDKTLMDAWKESVLLKGVPAQEPDLRTPFEKGLDSTEISEIIHP